MGNTNTNTARSRFNVGDRVVIRKDHHREPMPGVVVATSATMPVYRRIVIGWEAMPGGRIERSMVEAPGVDVRLDAVGYDSVSGLRVAAAVLAKLDRRLSISLPNFAILLANSLASSPAFFAPFAASLSMPTSVMISSLPSGGLMLFAASAAA